MERVELACRVLCPYLMSRLSSHLLLALVLIPLLLPPPPSPPPLCLSLPCLFVVAFLAPVGVRPAAAVVEVAVTAGGGGGGMEWC